MKNNDGQEINLKELKETYFNDLDNLRKNVNEDYVFIFLMSVYVNSDKQLKVILHLFKNKKFVKDFLKSVDNNEQKN